MTGFEYATLILLAMTGLGMPALGVMIRRQDAHRERAFNAIQTQLDHLDNCMDDMKERVLSMTVSRAELQEALTRQRSEIAGDTHGLHERIFRLENVQFEQRRRAAADV